MSESVKIRRFQPSDLPRMLAIHRRQGFDYTFPPLSEFCAAEVIENGHGPDTGLFLRRSAEAYMIMEPSMSPPEKMSRMSMLAMIGPEIAREQGIGEVYALIPPEIEQAMQKRLFQLGWEKKLWPMYAIQIGGE